MLLSILFICLAICLYMRNVNFESFIRIDPPSGSWKQVPIDYTEELLSSQVTVLLSLSLCFALAALLLNLILKVRFRGLAKHSLS